MPSALFLSEIKLLSQKFGGMMAKTIIVTAADINKNLSLYKRAKEMDIAVIDGYDIKLGNLPVILKSVADGHFQYKY